MERRTFLKAIAGVKEQRSKYQALVDEAEEAKADPEWIK